MRQLRIFFLGALTATLLFATLTGCGPQTPRQSPAQSGLSDIQVRELAIKYRDSWVAVSKLEKAFFFKSSKIQSVKKSTTGWDVIFRTGNVAQKGELLIYFLHVYIKPTGELDHVEEGGELIS